MATYNKDKDTLVEQLAKQNASNLVVEGEPIRRDVAEPLNVTNPAAPKGFEGSAKAVYTHSDSQGAVTDSMNKNSGLWWEAKAAGDTDWMKSLEAANKQLASLLGDGVTYNSGTGTWSGVADMPATLQGSMITGVNPVQPTYDYDAWAAENPAPTYQSAYNAQIDALMNQLLNREKFSYDAESDPLYQQYKNIYTREGNRSMNDTLAAAASGAGGMSSYAMTAAQQANNYYMAQLGDKIPELQQLAYSMYMDDLNLQRQDIGMLMDKDSVDYSRYRDSMSDWYNNRDFNYGQYRDQMGDYQWGTEMNYGAYRDQIADDRYNTEWNHALEREAIEDEWRQTEWDYGVERDSISDGRYDNETAWSRAMQMLSYGVMPDSSLLSAAGISSDRAAAILAARTVESSGGGNDGLRGDDDDSLELDRKPVDDDTALWNSIGDLGIGPVNANYVLDIAKYGGVVENDDGTLKWANGWNRDNYKDKLSSAKLLPHFDDILNIPTSTDSNKTTSTDSNKTTSTDSNKTTSTDNGDGNTYFTTDSRDMWTYAREKLGVSDDTTKKEMDRLYSFGAFALDDATLQYEWASGWSADNYKDKLRDWEKWLIDTANGKSLIG